MTDRPLTDTAHGSHGDKARQRRRNLVLGGVLVGLCALLFLVTIVRISGNA